MHIRKTTSPRRRQSGATLIVGLVLLLVLTVLGVSGMNTATMEVTMAGNTQFQQDAFQMAEDAIDIAIGTLSYTTEMPTVVDWTGNPTTDRRSVTTWDPRTTPVPDRAFSMAEGDPSAMEAFHFDIVAVGRGPRNAQTTHNQSFYVIGRALD
jgi:type IV pilus assembly protein PilX